MLLENPEGCAIGDLLEKCVQACAHGIEEASSNSQDFYILFICRFHLEVMKRVLNELHV